MKSMRKTCLGWMTLALLTSSAAVAQVPEFDPQTGSARINGGDPYGSYRVDPAQFANPADPGQAVYQNFGPYDAFGGGYAPPPGATLDPSFRAAAGLGGPSRDELRQVQLDLFHATRDIAGLDNGYTNVGAFIPMAVWGDYHIIAVNPRVLVDDDGNGGFNLGVLHRRYLPHLDRTFGSNFWWDYSNAYRDDYMRLGYGFESIGRYFSLRGDANWTLGDGRRVFSQTIQDPIFQGNSIALPIFEQFESPISDASIEVATPAPFLGKYGVELGLGAYFLHAAGVNDSAGISGRIKTQVTEDFSFNVVATHDDIFQGNLSFNFELRMPNGRPSRIMRPDPVVMSLTRPVQRNYQIRMAHGSQTSFLQEIDPQDTLPLDIAHIDPNRTTPGDGSVETPYMSFADYMSDTAARRAAYDIIWVQRRADDSAINLNTGITLTDRQHLFGNGTSPSGFRPTYTSTRGTFFLPGFSPGLRPLLSNGGNFANPIVTLAGDGTEVAAFRMTGLGGGTAISSPGAIDGFNIHDNLINNVVTGIDVTSNTAAATGIRGEDLALVHNNVINGIAFGGFRGVDILHTGGTVGLGIHDNTVSNFLGEDRDSDGVIFPTEDTNGNGRLDPGEDRNGNGQLDLSEDVNGNGVLDRGIGIEVTATAGNVIGTPLGNIPFLGIDNNETSQNAIGLQYNGDGTSLSTLSVTDNNSHDNQLHGMVFSANGGEIRFTDYSGNVTTTNGFEGTRWIANNGAFIRTLQPVVGNTFDGNRRHGMFIGAGNGARMFFQLGDPNDANTAVFDNTFNGNGTAGVGGDGLRIVFTNGATLLSTAADPAGLYNAEVTGNQGHGVVIDASNGTGGTSFNHFSIIDSDILQNGADGLHVNADGLNFAGIPGPPGLRNLLILNNRLSQNVRNGINFQLRNSNLVNHVISSNTITDNGIAGAGPVGPSNFNIEVLFNGGLTPSQQAVFALAAARWSQIITGDVPDVGLIDDVQITAEGAAIDGVGGVLGFAGPNTFRPNFIPITGGMRFDSADLTDMENNGTLIDVILHEMGHVLGVGTIWGAGFNNLIAGSGTPTPTFTGANALNEYNTRFGLTATGVPVEPNVEGHWDEAVFNNELMTPFISGPNNPISRVTVGQFEDLGYVVNYNAADPFLTAGANLGPTINFETQFIHDGTGITPSASATAAPAVTAPLSNLISVNAGALGHGINYSLDQSAIINGIVEGNDITGNGEDGISIENPQLGVPSTLTILNNDISQNGDAGVDVIMGGANVLRVDVRRNNFAGNGSFGFHLAGNENAIFHANFGGVFPVDGNTFTGNADANLAIELTDNASIPGILRIRNNSFNGAVDGANVDFDGEGVSLRGSGNSAYRRVRVIDNLFNGNASDGFRVDLTEFAQMHRAGNAAMPGLTFTRNTATANLNGVGIYRDADSVIRGFIGSGTIPTLGNTISNNTNHGLFVETRGSDLSGVPVPPASLGTNLLVGNNLFQANATDNVHIELFDLSTTNVSLVLNTIDGDGVSEDGVEVVTHNTSIFSADPTAPIANPTQFDGNRVFDHTDSGFEFTLLADAVFNNNSIQSVDIVGDSRQTQILRNVNGVVVNHANTGTSRIMIGNPASTDPVTPSGGIAGTPGTPVPGADAAPDAPDVLIANNTNDAIQHNHLVSGTAQLIVNNTLALGNRTLGGASQHGLNSLITQGGGITSIFVDHSTFTDFGDDGMHFLYDSGNNRTSGAFNPGGSALAVNVNVTNSVTGQDAFSLNNGDGVDIELWDTTVFGGANFVFDNHHSFNNGGDGLRLLTFAENISGSNATVAPDHDSTIPPDQPEVVTNQNPGLLARGDYFTDTDATIRPAGLAPTFNNTAAAVYGDVDAIDVTANLSVTNSNIRFNGGEGVELGVGAATQQNVVIRGSQLFANAETDVFTHTITNELAVKQDSVNNGDVAPAGNLDTVNLDPLAHLYLNFGDAGDPNSGNQINAIGYRASPGNLSGVFTNTDSIRGVNRVIGINFNIFTNPTNVFTLSGNPITTFNAAYGTTSTGFGGLPDGGRHNFADNNSNGNVLNGDNPERGFPTEAGVVNTP